PLTYTPFPYPTLFRSRGRRRGHLPVRRGGHLRGDGGGGAARPGHDGGIREGTGAVRPSHRVLPGGAAPLRRHVHRRARLPVHRLDRKSTRLNFSHVKI